MGFKTLPLKAPPTMKDTKKMSVMKKDWKLTNLEAGLRYDLIAGSYISCPKTIILIGIKM
jgi:hypothetical protein